MASGKIRGITVEIGGDTTKLGKALEGVNKTTRDLQSELRGVESLLKMDPGNTDLLAQRQEILTEAVAETTEKLELLKKVEEQVVDQFNKGDIGADQFRDFQREIIVTQNKLEDFESKLNGTEGELEDVGTAAENSGDGFTIMGGALADLVASAIKGAISAIGDLIGSLLDLSEATEEYRTMQAKLEGSANTFGYSADFAKAKYEEFYKYLGDDQAATNAITNLMGVGTSTESLSKLVEGATGAWATYGDSINIESLTEAVNETITCGKVTGSFADTINWCKDANVNLKSALSGNKEAQSAFTDALEEGLPVEDAFNEALAKITDEQERADVVAQFLNTTYGESKKTYDELNGSINDANQAELELKETQAQLGETMQPVNTALTDMKNQALSTITPLVESLANGFMNLYNWLKENPTAMTILTAVAIALATAFGVLATALAIQGIITGVTKAIAFLNTTLLANPIVLIVAAIAGLVAAFIYLWNNCDAFRQFWIDLWNKIKAAFSAVVAWFKETAPKIAQFFVNAWNKIKEIWSGVKSFFGNVNQGIKNVFAGINNWFADKFRAAWNGIKNIWSAVKGFFSNIWSGIKNTFSSVGSWFKEKFTTAKNNVVNAFSNIKAKFSEIWTKIKSAFKISDITKIGKDLVEGLWNGINDKVSWIKSKLVGFKDAVMNALKSFFGIKSPSRLMRDEIGYQLSAGVAAGISSDEPIKAMHQMSDDILASADSLNTITLNRQLETTFKGSSATDTSIVSRLDDILTKLERRTQIVLDTGTLVGETLDKIDAGLADRQLLSARGV